MVSLKLHKPETDELAKHHKIHVQWWLLALKETTNKNMQSAEQPRVVWK